MKFVRGLDARKLAISVHRSGVGVWITGLLLKPDLIIGIVSFRRRMRVARPKHRNG
jgi:hypothetical protein